MKASKKIEGILKDHKKELAEIYKIKELGIFGSYIRGEQKKRSDVDILVEFDEPVTFFEFVALEKELSKLIGKKADLVMKTALKPRIGKHILEEVIYV